MPSSLEATVEAGQTASQTLTLQNTSGAPVAFRLRTAPTPRPGLVARPSGARSNAEHPRLPLRRSGGEGAEVLVIQDFAAWGLDLGAYLADAFGIAATTISHTQIAATDFAEYDLIITSGDQSFEYYGALSNNVAKFEAFVADGGVVQYQLATQGDNVAIVAGAEVLCCEFADFNDIAAPDHPIVEGLSTPLFGTSASHTTLSNLPDHALVITTAVGSGSPTTAEYRFGSGHVIVTGMTWEYLYVFEFEAGQLLPNAVAYALTLSGVSWLAVDPEAGTIPASGSTSIEVTFDATSLFAGSYEAVIEVLVEDAVVAAVPVTLTVTGEPEIAVTPPALDFGTVFVGATAEASVTVSNEGTAPLTISAITVSDPAFSVDADALTLQPMASATLTVTFAPTAVGVVSAVLTLASDDATDPTVTVSLTGEGVPPPVVMVEPEAITAEAESGETVTRSLTISNTGGSPLTFTVLPQASAGRAPAVGATNTRGHTRGGHLISSRRHEASVPGPGSAERGLGLARSTRSDGRRFLAPDEHLLGGVLPTLATDPAGDGGAADVVAIRGRFTPSGFTVEFEFVAPIDLAAFLPALLLDVDQDPDTGVDVSFLVDAALGVEFEMGVQEGFDGPEAYIIDVISGNFAFAPAVVEGNTLRFSFPGGVLSGLEDGANVVGLTYDFNAGVVRDAVPDSGFFTVSEAPPWLSVTPESGTVEAGGTAELTVTLDASELFAGTYEAVLLITTNDPVTPTETVPVTFTVTGEPELDVPAELDFGTVFAGFPATRALTVANDGTDVLTVEVSSSDPALAVDPASFTVAPASARAVAVTVTAPTTGAFAFTLTLVTNDADEPSVEVAVTGTAVEAPVVAVAPAALAFEVEVGTTESAVLTIENGGGSPLDFEISAQRAGLRAGSGGRPAAGGTWGRTRGRAGFFAASTFAGRGELPLLYEDAVGDASFPPDLRALRGLVTGTDLVLQLQVDGSLNANDFGGFVGLDVDEDPATGEPLPFGLPEQEVGVEYIVELFNVGFGEVVLLDAFFNVVGFYPATVEGGAVTFSIPLADLVDDGSLTLAGVIGNFNGPTDWFPESGAIAVGNVSFLTFSPEAGTVPVGESAEVTVMVDASDLAVGTYDVEIVVATNDPARPTVVVPVTVEVVLGEAGEPDARPVAYTLHPLYPNPLRVQGVVAFDLPEAASVSLELFDVQGRRVAALVEGERAAGRHTAVLDAATLPSGVYLCRLHAGSFTATTKVVVLH